MSTPEPLPDILYAAKYLPTMGDGRESTIEEGVKKGKDFASADYPYAVAQERMLSQLAEKEAERWTTHITELTKERIADPLVIGVKSAHILR